jgi:hypothetical protein
MERQYRVVSDMVSEGNTCNMVSHAITAKTTAAGAGQRAQHQPNNPHQLQPESVEPAIAVDVVMCHVLTFD